MKPNFPITSVSRLNTYVQCGELYRFKYVEKLRTPEEFNPNFVIGRLTHQVLEEILDPETDSTDSLEVFSLLLESWVKQYGLDNLRLEDILKTVIPLGKLFYRASARCHGDDAIRNQNGTIPSNVIEYPPSSWTKAMKESGLHQARYALDNIAGNCNPIFIKHPLSYLLAEAYSYVYNFQPPPWLKTIGVEVPLSTTDTNKVLFPGEANLFVNAYIDWVVEIEGDVFILDHKTDASKPSPVDVLHHVQLVFYAYLYEMVYGISPKGIGIHHLPTGSSVLAEVDKEVQVNTVEYLREIQDQIYAKRFLKRHPGEYNSPCVKKDWKTKDIVSTCPYLDKCWSSFHEAITPVC